MNTRPLVSVIIPIYNSEHFLKESIESVLNQTYSNIEIICVNDGSNDNSLEVLNQFSNKVTIITQQNNGLASSLNTGIEAMNGRWFKWFSPDDKMNPSTIETLVNAAKNLDDNTIIYSNWDIIDDNGKKLRSFAESNYNNLNFFDFNVRLLDGQQINANTALIPYTLMNNLKMNTKIDPVLVDYSFFLSAGLAHNTKFHLVERSLVQFRIHQNQLSHQKIKQSLQSLTTVREQILSDLDPKMKNQYLEEWKKYRKSKSFSKKSLETGLRLISALPEPITDKILVFYLNKIRRGR